MVKLGLIAGLSVREEGVHVIARRFERRMAKATRKSSNQAVDLDLGDGGERADASVAPAKRRRGRPRKDSAEIVAPGASGGASAGGDAPSDGKADLVGDSPNPETAGVEVGGSGGAASGPSEGVAGSGSGEDAEDRSATSDVADEKRAPAKKKPSGASVAPSSSFWHIMRMR